MTRIVTGGNNIAYIRSILHGNGVCGTKPLRPGDVAFTEIPTNFLQAIPNKQDAVVCSKCARFIGTVGTQLSLLTRDIGRQGYVNDSPSFDGDMCLAPIVPCYHQCGDLYCSEACRAYHFEHGHRLLCTGLISEEEAEFHPLIEFKQHAVMTNEIFLLVADIFAELCIRVESANEESRQEVVLEYLGRYDDFVRHLWWDVALVSNGNCTPEEQSQLQRSIHTIVHESWNLLCRALTLEERGLTDVLSIEYMARTIGMFEQNNVGVRLENPLVEYTKQLPMDSTATSCVLESTQRIVGGLDDAGDEEDEEFSGEEDVEDNNGQEEGESIGPSDVECMVTGGDEQGEAGQEGGRNELFGILDEVGADTVYPPLDGTAFYTTICRINHSCNPNVMVKYVCTPEHGLCAQMVVLRDIAEGEELLQSYIDQSLDTSERQALLRDYGFQCTCELCAPGGPSDEATGDAGCGIGSMFCQPCV